MSDRLLATVLRRQTERLGPRCAIRAKRRGLWHDVSWDERLEMVRSASAALLAAGLKPGDRVAILSENRPEWVIADLAIMGAGMVSTPLHAPLSTSAIRFQLEHSEASWLFVSTAAQIEKVVDLPAILPNLLGIVSFDRLDNAADWEAFLHSGRNAGLGDRLDAIEAETSPHDLATIMYTSGTTGNPKGVMLTHGNLLSNAAAIAECADAGPDAVFFDWLPLSHIYARTVELYQSIVVGATLALAESPETVVADLAEIQPTKMESVPRFYEKVVASVACLSADERRKKLRAIFGPRLRWLGSGGAPLPPSVGQTLVDAGLRLLPGYGMTESSPVIAINRFESPKHDTVGSALPGTELKIAADGEVLTYGPHVMKGYWKQRDATEHAIRDGWLHTGDLGMLDDDGHLRITGRKKDLLVLSNGKKVSPTHVESMLLADPCFDQAIVYGEGRHFLCALVVPNWNRVAACSGLDAASPRLHAFLVERAWKATEDAAPWECIKQVVVAPEPFSVAAGELTVSQKMRRETIFAHWKNELEAVYSRQ
ncbi:MAG: AMP-dependent synthetase/ligase [Gemmataceae bacterium]|nr:AMP-dependent synthetase/ligase [Gemmataceae bacterium]MBX9681808.1 AMP-dependent synthetase/ligase [Gemmataceae bacterium]